MITANAKIVNDSFYKINEVNKNNTFNKTESKKYKAEEKIVV